MGGALKSIGGAIGGVIKQVAPSVIKAIAPAASKLLGGIAGDIFQKGAGFIKNALAASPLPGPLKAIGEKLLGTGLDKLTQFAQGGIDKLIQSLGDMVTKRFAPGAGNIALPGLPGRQDAIANNNPAAPSSSSSAATGSSSSAATGSTGSSNPSGASSSSNLPPKPLTGEEAKDVGKQNEYNQKMFDYQQAMSNMNKFWEMMSTVQKSHDQTRGSMIQNLR
ncbi:MAG: hypothetical protein Q8N23_03765 [Archangium sp.]|nr:hypothetical protein [Archangium sp.]MDP3151762.1 hypothetical protein [Archangium sp.]MDP3573280.1 hypothetical protein [Archangium sp.]